MRQCSVYTSQLPPDRHYETGWVTHKISLGEEIQAFDYHDKMDCYVLGTSQKLDFRLPEDEFHYEWSNEGDYIVSQQHNVPAAKLLRIRCFAQAKD